MKVTFIKHSCYTVETEKHYLVFDYFSGELDIPKDKMTVFFVSHRHSDHFSQDIFKYNADLYIISNDVNIENSDKIKIVEPDSEYWFNDIYIQTVKSTDEGLAFFVRTDDKAIIHSGDLCHWVWPRYSKEEQLKIKEDFENAVNKFKNNKVDIVFMVMDPRLNTNFDLTGKFFLENINASYYFPMHMWDNFHISSRFRKLYADKYPDKNIMTVKHNNEIFNID